MIQTESTAEFLRDIRDSFFHHYHQDGAHTQPVSLITLAVTSLSQRGLLQNKTWDSRQYEQYAFLCVRPITFIGQTYILYTVYFFLLFARDNIAII